MDKQPTGKSLSDFAPSAAVMQLFANGAPTAQVDLYHGVTFRRLEKAGEEAMVIPAQREGRHGYDYYLVTEAVVLAHKEITQIASVYKVVTHKREIGYAIVPKLALNGRLSSYSTSLHSGIEAMGGETKRVVSDREHYAYHLETVEDIALPEEGEDPSALDIGLLFKGEIDDPSDPRIMEIKEQMKSKGESGSGKPDEMLKKNATRRLIRKAQETTQPELDDDLRDFDDDLDF